MTAVIAPPQRPAAIAVPPIGYVLVALGIVSIYLVLQENGLLLASSWETLHELFHDGRHALGVPCH